MALVVIGSAIGVAIDASRLGARRGGLGGGFLDMGPAGWFFSVWLFWIVGFPAYLATRPKLVGAAMRTATRTWQGEHGPYDYPPFTPSPVTGPGHAVSSPAPVHVPPVPPRTGTTQWDWAPPEPPR